MQRDKSGQSKQGIIAAVTCHILWCQSLLRQSFEETITRIEMKPFAAENR